MLTSAAEKHFEGRAGIARKLSDWTRGAVYAWGEIVPLVAARELERLSEGAVAVDYTLYKKSGHADLKRLREQAEQAA